MFTKIVYTVVSSSSDYYLEQTLLSVYTLRQHNPSAHVTLVLDRSTNDAIQDQKFDVNKIFDKIKIVDVPDEYTKEQRSRYLKTTLREYVDGDFLFIDSDTLITSSIEEIDSLDCAIGAVADKHVPIRIHPRKDLIYNRAKVLCSPVDEDSIYVNSGVIYCKDTPLTHDFYREWHEYWKVSAAHGINADQPALAKANAKYGGLIKEMCGTWNCQLTDNGLKYLLDAKILHYFASTSDGHIISPYRFYKDDIFEEIKQNGRITARIQGIAMDPKREFDDLCRIISSNDFRFLDSFVHKLYLKHNTLFEKLDWFAKLCLKF